MNIMELPDFSQMLPKIKKSRESIINYYVSQYGEETRNIWEERFDRINWCFFVSPESMDYYIAQNGLAERINDETIEFLKLVGIDVDLTIPPEELFEKYPEQMEYIATLFPYGGVGPVITNRGLYAFLNEEIHNISEKNSAINSAYDWLRKKDLSDWTIYERYSEEFGRKSLYFHNEEYKALYGEAHYTNKELIIAYERVKFLEAIGEKDESVPFQDYIKTEEYKELTKRYSDLAKTALEHKKRAEAPFIRLSEYSEKLKTGQKKIATAMEKRLVTDFYGTDKAYERDLFFGSDSLTLGLIISFSEENLATLKNPEVGDFEKYKIVQKQEMFLLNVGYDVSDELKELLLQGKCYEIPELNNFLPNQERLKVFIEDAKRALDNYQVAIASSCIVSGSPRIGHYPEIAEFVLSPNKMCCAPHTDGKGNVKEVNIFFNPMMYNQDALDVFIRHEIRHAMTASARLLEPIFNPDTGEYVHIEELKLGNQLTLYKTAPYEKALIKGDSFVIWNEAVTQYEAILETKSEWEKGNYILNEPGTHFPSITTFYDDWLDDFAIIYEILPPDAKRSVIESTNNSLFRYILPNELEEICTLIADEGFHYKASKTPDGTVTIEDNTTKLYEYAKIIRQRIDAYGSPSVTL